MYNREKLRIVEEVSPFLTGLEAYLPLETDTADISGNSRNPVEVNGGGAHEVHAIGPVANSTKFTEALYDSAYWSSGQWSWLRTQINNDLEFTIDGFFEPVSGIYNTGGIFSRSGSTANGSSWMGCLDLGHTHWIDANKEFIAAAYWPDGGNIVHLDNWRTYSDPLYLKPFYYCFRYDGFVIDYYLYDLAANAVRRTASATVDLQARDGNKFFIGMSAFNNNSAGSWTYHHNQWQAHMGFWSRRLTDQERLDRRDGLWLPTSL